MLTASKMHSPEQFEREAARENLRDRRWRRHRNMIWTATAVLMTLVDGDRAVDVLVRLIT